MRQLNNKLLAQVNERLGKINGVMRDIEVLRENDESLLRTLESVYKLICDEVEVDSAGKPNSDRDVEMLRIGTAVCREIQKLERGL